MSAKTSRFYSFDSFTLDASRRTLLREGEPVPLKPKAFETLLALVQSPGRVVGKDELMRALWPDSFVEEANLTQQVSLVRKALGDDPKEPRFIVTVPGRGYSFVADVREAEETAAAPGPEPAPQESPRPPEAEAEAPTHVSAGAASRPARGRGAARRWVPFVVTAAVVAAAFALGYLWSGRGGEAADAPVRSIAVLPFKSAAGGAEDDYLRLGLADALISRFSGLSRVAVRQLGEVLKYDKPGQDPLAAGRALKVDAVLDGLIQKTGDRVRVTARLLDTRTGQTLWAQTFDERWTDIFVVQDTIAFRVSGALAPNLSGEDRARVAKRFTNNAEAYELYLQAAYLYGRRTPEALAKSDEYFRRAIELDPNFALAYQGMAIVYGETHPTLSPREAQQKSKEYLLKALELDDTLATSHAMMALLKWRSELNREEAESYYRRAIEMEPNSMNPHRGYGIFLAEQGRVGEAIDELRRAQSASPTSLSTMAVLGTMYVYARRYDEAVAQYRRVLEMEPSYATAHANLGWVYVMTGRYAEAEASLRKALEVERISPSNVHAFLGHLYALTGRRAEARGEVERLNELRKQKRGSWGALAVVYAGLGDNDRAFECLDKALEEREWWSFSVKVNPLFDRLHPDPRFADLVRRTGLAP
jgi:DNA-binding winged helix-turn-helix (wHTH) protein/TolB-like protein/Tfp pilus assembly protein PilF